MTTRLKAKKVGPAKKVSARDIYIITQFRFADQEHKELVDRAVKYSGLPSMNAWLIQATIKQARKELES